MDADREREIRELAVALSASQRHGRIGLVLRELLAEIDACREMLASSPAQSHT